MQSDYLVDNPRKHGWAGTRQAEGKRREGSQRTGLSELVLAWDSGRLEP